MLLINLSNINNFALEFFGGTLGIEPRAAVLCYAAHPEVNLPSFQPNPEGQGVLVVQAHPNEDKLKVTVKNCYTLSLALDVLTKYANNKTDSVHPPEQRFLKQKLQRTILLAPCGGGKGN